MSDSSRDSSTKFNHAVQALRSGSTDEAKQILFDIVESAPQHFDALHQLGLLVANQGEPVKALHFLERAILANPRSIAARTNLGIIYFHLGRLDSALMHLSAAVEIAPNNEAANYYLGLSLGSTGRLPEAITYFDRAIAANPKNPDVLYNRATALLKLERPHDALTDVNLALAFRKDSSVCHHLKGCALIALGRTIEALASFDAAIERQPNLSVAFNDRGFARMTLGRLTDALSDFESALILSPNDKIALHNKAEVLHELDRLEESVSVYEKAISLHPDEPTLFGRYLYTKIKLCDWRHFPELLPQFERSLELKPEISTPFPTLMILDRPDLHRIVATRYFSKCRLRDVFPPAPKIINQRKIRIGYFSADFHNHATSYLLAEVIESHDRREFECIAFSFGPRRDDHMQRRMRRAFDQFIDVRDRSDDEVAAISRQLNIDIAIDLKGFTKDSRPRIFAQRCAPIQVNFLGYPGTLGATVYDYIIGDRVVTPMNDANYYAEKIVQLPGCYQPNDSQRVINDNTIDRNSAGLPTNGFVFCCFNASQKILPETFDSWTRILANVPASVLWLLGSHPLTVSNLRREFVGRGMESERLVFASYAPPAEHLSRIKLADLFLDTWPCSAHTTASDSLWAAVPIVARIGKSFASRVSASLLTSVGLSELITHESTEYEALSISLGNDPQRVTDLKRHLEHAKRTSNLFNGPLFARNLGRAYRAMQERRLRGLAPAHMELKD